MDRKTYFKKITVEFEKWWTNDPHSSYMDYYKNLVSYSYLKSLSKKEFVAFFYEFVSKGGLIQSGGNRNKNDFLTTVLDDFENFKQFVIEPFQNNFTLRDWFLKLDEFPGFGVGIATIFLNRIDYNKYPIMNNKTLKALNMLGYKISSTKNWHNYELVKEYQDNLIKNYNNFTNYFKVDAFNHFLVSVYQGQELISDYLQIETFENGLEQNEIEQNEENDTTSIEKENLYDKIIECEKDNSEIIVINGKKYKRHNYLMVQIKKYRKFKCQFCSTKILKANGKYYIEACHIKPKAKGGEDSLNNILILCPNCHKLFDYGLRKEEKHTKEAYSVTLNGKKYKATLK